MNFLNILKTCEPNVSQIARDAELARQAVYLWKDGSIPRPAIFKRLLKLDKYNEALLKLDYDALRRETPLGRKVGTKNKKSHGLSVGLV